LRDTELNKRRFDINLKSVTEQNSLEEFLNTAELAGTEFESEKLNLRFVKPMANAGVLSKEEQSKLNELHKKNTDLLRIPRRYQNILYFVFLYIKYFKNLILKDQNGKEQIWMLKLYNRKKENHFCNGAEI
jgi:hypothetical protein